MSKDAAVPSIALWGCASRQTAATLRALLEANIPVRCLVIAGTTSRIPTPSTVPLAIWHTDPLTLAHRHDILVVRIPHRRVLHERLGDRRLAAELGLVSCFPWKLPPEIGDIYPRGMVNLHPSLLPTYRGPAPLFWQYRDGCLTTGVTLHRVTEEMDGGPLLAQVRSALPLAFPGDRLEAWLAWYGVGLLLRTIRGERNELCSPTPTLQSSWAPIPRLEDSVIDWTWPCWRAAHFLNGVLGLGYAATVRDEHGQYWRVERFLAWTPYRSAPSGGSSAIVALEFADGYLMTQARPL